MASNLGGDATLEWFGATTFRLRVKGLTIFLDTWLERPSNIPTFLKVDDVDDCDYIFISHAHFDHLPGADRLAKKTGAIIIANGEAITVMRTAGVPETQLQPVAGGERLPLFTRAQRDAAVAKQQQQQQQRRRHGDEDEDEDEDDAPAAGPRFPPTPDPSEAVIDVHVWPALHCLLPPGDHASMPAVIDTGTVYTGDGGNRYACTIDITRNMTYGFGGLMKMMRTMPPGASPPPQLPQELRAFLPYMNDRETNRYSFYDGGQLMYNFLLDKEGGSGPTLLWHGHLGCYEGIMKLIEPKPDVAILAIAGRGNLNGRPFDGSAAEFAVKEIQWLGEPKKVIWCLHDNAPIIPKSIDTKAATELVHKETKSKIADLEHVKVYKIFD